MAIIDVKKNVIQGKIVYYGPGLCGKTTNLEYVNRAVPNTQPMMSLSTEGDRTIFFDFLPLDLGQIRGINTKFKLYTVPGQVRYNLTRKMVLKNADGVVFVADSQVAMIDANLESLENLFANLQELKMDPASVPIVIQYNKRDLPDVSSPEEMNEVLNPTHFPVFLASAKSGEGVIETLREISKIVFSKLASDFAGHDEKDAAPKKTAKAAVPPPPPAAAKARAPAEKKSAQSQDGKGRPDATIQITTRKQEAPAEAKAPAAGAVAADAGSQDEDKPPAPADIECMLSQQEKSIALLLEKSAGKIADAVAAEVQRRIEESLEKRLKAQAAPGSDQAGPGREEGTKEIKDELVRIATHAKNNLATRKDLEDLRKELTGVVQRAVADLKVGAQKEAPREDPTKMAEQIKTGLPTKRDLDELRKEMAKELTGIQEQAKASSSAQRDAVAVHKEASKAIEAVSSQIAGIQRAFEQAIGHLRQEIALSSQASVRAPNGGAASMDAPLAKPASKIEKPVKAAEPPQAKPEPVKAAEPPQPEPVKAAEPPQAKPEPEPVKAEEPPQPEPVKAAEPPKAKPEPVKAAEPPQAKPEPEPVKAAEPPQAKPEPEPVKAAEPPKPEPAVAPDTAGQPRVEERLSDDPLYKNAMRVARVMMSDLGLYYTNDVAEGIKTGDIHERLKNQFEEMRKTYDARIPEAVRAKKDFLKEAIDLFVEKKRMELNGA